MFFDTNITSARFQWALACTLSVFVHTYREPFQQPSIVSDHIILKSQECTEKKRLGSPNMVHLPWFTSDLFLQKEEEKKATVSMVPWGWMGYSTGLSIKKIASLVYQYGASQTTDLLRQSLLWAKRFGVEFYTFGALRFPIEAWKPQTRTVTHSLSRGV